MAKKGEIKIIIGACLFGLIPVFVRYGDELSIQSRILGRAVFATLFAWFYLTYKKEKIGFKIQEIYTTTFVHFFVWTLFLTFAILFYFLSITLGSVSLSGVLLGVHPVFVVFFVFIFFKERISLKTWIACLIAMLGITIITIFSSTESSGSIGGSLYALASSFFLGLNFTYYLKYLKGFSTGKLVFYQNILQIPILLPFALFDPGVITLKGIISIICLGVFCTGIAYFLIYSGSQTVKKQNIGILQIIENIIPVIIGVAFYLEKINLESVVGILLILASVVMISFDTQKEGSIPKVGD